MNVKESIFIRPLGSRGPTCPGARLGAANWRSRPGSARIGPTLCPRKLSSHTDPIGMEEWTGRRADRINAPHSRHGRLLIDSATTRSATRAIAQRKGCCSVSSSGRRATALVQPAPRDLCEPESTAEGTCNTGRVSAAAAAAAADSPEPERQQQLGYPIKTELPGADSQMGPLKTKTRARQPARRGVTAERRVRLTALPMPGLGERCCGEQCGNSAVQKDTFTNEQQPQSTAEAHGKPLWSQTQVCSDQNVAQDEKSVYP
ncbi:hypothetical protein EYF80_050091 [Liparis tanakae]|uniref:Uncharacterized protein n=1 Tax=Liparis tanakae TaxID=230148 RepID=A0A4Z2FHC9_9TELE|nr:hypothetical protein EYF80_050091 [Liparis tanakae]